MNPEQLAELKNNQTLRKRLAKFMARECFRSSPRLEDMHTEGKIGQEDMKELMIDVVNRTYRRVGEEVTPLAPHSPGRARLTHPVLRA